jgi:tRNA pseudouridine38-40 synthase
VSPASRRIRLDLAYDGTDFAGWQLQAEARTIQGTLEEALSRLHGDRPVRVRGAGRTDAGAHARGQVADCELCTDKEDADLLHALRCMLPADLAALGLRTVSRAFHSQRDATGKTYRYLLDLTRHGDPLLARYALRVRHRIDRELLDDALSRLPGERDWSGFAAAACTVRNRIRRLTEARCLPAPDDNVWLSFTAGGFLTHMVRNIVGTLLEIARGQIPLERMDEILTTGERTVAGPTAPARGLHLWAVHYGDSPSQSVV